MLLLINHRYPVLGSVLSALSSVLFIAIGIHTHHSGLIIFSMAGIAPSVMQFTYRRRRGAAAARKGATRPGPAGPATGLCAHLAADLKCLASPRGPVRPRFTGGLLAWKNQPAQSFV